MVGRRSIQTSVVLNSYPPTRSFSSSRFIRGVFQISETYSHLYPHTRTLTIVPSVSFKPGTETGTGFIWGPLLFSRFGLSPSHQKLHIWNVFFKHRLFKMDDLFQEMLPHASFKPPDRSGQAQESSRCNQNNPTRYM